MADVVRRATQPALGAIKLAWWRERLEELDEGKVPAEPRLQAAAAELVPRGIRGADLAGLEEGWATLLQETADREVALGRGAKLFALAGRLLDGGAPAVLDPAGRIYAAGSLLRIGLPSDRLFTVPERPGVPRRYRPLTGLAALAARDLKRGLPSEPEGTPGRAWTLLRHRLTGCFPGS